MMSADNIDVLKVNANNANNNNNKNNNSNHDDNHHDDHHDDHHENNNHLKLNLLIGLPDDITYKILCYIDTPNNIVSILCQSITVLCKATKSYVDHNDNLWEAVLGGYYLDHLNSRSSSRSSSTNTSTSSAYHARTQRRSSKRLRRTTAKEDVIHAHFVLRDQTEMALQEIADLAISKTPHPLTLSKLRSILKTYGPNLNINQRSAIGGTMLVDVLRGRYVKESVILSCVKELIEIYHASPLVPATEGAKFVGMKRKKKKRKKKIVNSSNNGNTNSTIHSSGGNDDNDYDDSNNNTLPPLVIAAARGMPSIVKYLLTLHNNTKEERNRSLEKSRSKSTSLSPPTSSPPMMIRTMLDMKGTSRFRLFTNPKKSICGTYTPLEFALRMKEAEIEQSSVGSKTGGSTNVGINDDDLKSLNQCIRLLSSFDK